MDNTLPITIEGKTPQEMRNSIFALEAYMLKMPHSVTELPLKHYFSHGIYMREISIPAGMVITGKIHLTGHLSILSKGDVTVWTDEGMKRLKASSVIQSKPGIKRVIYAHEDSVWITVHHTFEKCPDTIEALITTNDPTLFITEGA